MQPGIIIQIDAKVELEQAVSSIYARLTSIHFDDRLVIRQMLGERAVIEQQNKSPYLLKRPNLHSPIYTPVTREHGALVLALFVASAKEVGGIEFILQNGRVLTNFSAETLHQWDASTPIKDIAYVLNAKAQEKDPISRVTHLAHDPPVLMPTPIAPTVAPPKLSETLSPSRNTIAVEELWL